MADEANWSELNRQRAAEAMELLYKTYIVDTEQAEARGAAIRAIDAFLVALGGVVLSSQIEQIPWSKRLRESGEPELLELEKDVMKHLDNLEQPPAGKIVETRTVYSVSDTDPPISRQLDMQDAAREGTPRTDAECKQLGLEPHIEYVDGLMRTKSVWSTKVSADFARQLERELASATAALAEEREIHRMQLTAISVAALANTRESAQKQAIYRTNPYWSVAYGDVVTAVSREIHERERAELAEAELAKAKHENKECWHYKTLWQQAADERDALTLALAASREECAKVCNDYAENRMQRSEKETDQKSRAIQAHKAVTAISLRDAIHSLDPPSRERGEALLKELEGARKDAERWRLKSGRQKKELHRLNKYLYAFWKGALFGGRTMTRDTTADAAIKEGRG